MAKTKATNSALPTDISAMSFETAMEELENIIRNLEQGNTELEASISQYTRGMHLKKHCEQMLANAKMRVEKILVNKEDGTVQGVELLDKE